MNIPILGGIAFVVGLGAGTGAVMMRAPAPSAHATADSTAVAAHASTAPHAAPAPAATTAEGVKPAAAAAVEPAAIGHDVIPQVNPVRAAISGRAAAAAPEDFTQVSKILGSMKPTEAAKILAFLSDDQVEGIVRALGVRQAALMLTQLPTERAAAMSRRLLHPNPEHVQ